jgi:hypothetical protein
VYRWLIIPLVAWHIVAIVVASLPPPEDTPRQAGGERAAAAMAKRAIDWTYQGYSTIYEETRPVLGPVRRAARFYLRNITLGQNWNMFSEPPNSDQYIHLRYYVEPVGEPGTAHVARELIFPARDEETFRAPNAAYYEEKALRNARQRFLTKLRTLPNVTRVSELPRDLEPVVRYYSSRYRRRLPEDEQLTRTEIWLGSAPVPPPGSGDAAQAAEREAVLGEYRRETADAAGGVAPAAHLLPHPVGTKQTEADISWTLFYVLTWEAGDV